MGNEASLDPSDARTNIANLETSFNAELAARKRMIELAKGDRSIALSRIDTLKSNGKSLAQAGGGRDEVTMGKLMLYVSAAFILLIAIGLGAAYGVMWIAGDSLA